MGEEAPASKALRRMPLAKTASWELVCHLKTLFVSQWKSKRSCIIHVGNDKRLKNCMNRARKSLGRRDFQVRFSFSKIIAQSFYVKDLSAVLPTGFGESLICQLLIFVLGYEDRNRLCLQALLLFPRSKHNSGSSGRGTFYRNVSR